jgi:hypothetical protein
MEWIGHTVTWVADLLKYPLYVVFLHCRHKQKVDGVLGKVDEAVSIGVVYGNVNGVIG